MKNDGNFFIKNILKLLVFQHFFFASTHICKDFAFLTPLEKNIFLISSQFCYRTCPRSVWLRAFPRSKWSQMLLRYFIKFLRHLFELKEQLFSEHFLKASCVVTIKLEKHRQICEKLLEYSIYGTR